MYDVLLMNASRKPADPVQGKKTVRLLLHIAFWLFFTVVFFISPPKPLSAGMLISWFSILTVVMLVVYVNLYVLIPSLYFKRQFLAYFLTVALVLIGGAYLITKISQLDFVILRMPFTDNLKNLFFFIVISGAFKLYRDHERKKRQLEAFEKNKLQMELSFLKSQVNPHFLFNTLNNIYAANMENSDAANEMILKLSDILRFQLEAARKDLIPLEEEIALVENYIGLEKIRTLHSKVEFRCEGDFRNFMLPPLLLLPLVENAFKYGKNVFIFQVSLSQYAFLFEANNEMQSSKRFSVSSKKTGIGIANVRKRLELVFPGKFTFDVSQDEKYFKVSLRIDLSD